MSGSPPLAGGVPAIYSWCAILLCYAALLAVGWPYFGDAVVDFGRDLYLASRLNAGDVLYRDHAFFDGPLSPYLNALVLAVGGATINAVKIANAAWLLIAVCWWHRMLCAVADRGTALVGCLLFLSAFGLAHTLDNGNYNFIAPYSAPVVHGVVLSLGALLSLWKWFCCGGPRWLAGAGVALGLVFLTKADLLLALALTTVVGFVLGRRFGKRGEGMFGRDLASLIIPTLAPPLIAFLLLLMAMPAADALRGTLGTWPSVWSGEAAQLALYKTMLGTDNIRGNLLRMMLTGLGWAALFGVLAAAARWLCAGHPRVLVAQCAAAAVVLLVMSQLTRGQWVNLFRPLPLVVVLALILALRELRIHRGPRELARVTLALWALLLLGKMILNVRAEYYGFALAAPAVLVALALLGSWIPQALEARGRAGGLLRTGAFTAAVAVGVMFILLSTAWHEKKFRRITTGAGTVRVDPEREPVLAELLSHLEEQLDEPRATLAVLPEGAMLNFLLRRRNSTRHSTAVPTEVVLFGEEMFLRDFARDPPDVIVFLHKDTTEFGYRAFGKDYAVQLAAWVRENYESTALIGEEPFTGRDFGARVFRKRIHLWDENEERAKDEGGRMKDENRVARGVQRVTGCKRTSYSRLAHAPYKFVTCE